VTELLRAMKADGIKWPFSASYTQFGPETIWNQFASFGVPENTYYYFIDADNKVQFTCAQDGWRACVEWLHQRYEDSKWYAEAGVLEPKSFQYLRDLSKMSNDDATEAADIYTELQKLVEESFANFVRNGVTDESWNNFLEQAKAIGSERYIELYQTAYDHYLAK